MKQYNSLQDVAEVLKNGTIAVIPTETVYGLAATVFDDNAVKKIFEKKRRPADNPLIVHLSHRDQIDSIAIVENELERKLIDLWMPGPFTILLKKKEIISDLVTAGSDLVAVRVPSHPLAQQLLEKVGVPLAAPSANPSGKPSPTSAEMAHFYFPELKILDGGACHTGIESTVVYVDGSEVVVMRPGLITA
ncbi:MAG TPA: L-threonylcarbamoyladenylate synthase, partial [Candidatus Absconditabacterales bacterium]|nr:L-threonylcarbamoyladenylate synthase [Candidatus Absconditabacterales bacterium]